MGGSNTGQSYIVGLGDYTRGELWVQDIQGDVEMSATMKNAKYKVGDRHAGKRVNVHVRWHKLDG